MEYHIKYLAYTETITSHPIHYYWLGSPLITLFRRPAAPSPTLPGHGDGSYAMCISS